MAEQIFGELSRLLMENLEVVRKALQKYREEKKKLIETLEVELKKQRLKWWRSWDSDIREDVHTLALSPHAKKEIHIVISAEQMKESKIAITSWEKAAGRWEEGETKEISIKDKSLDDVAKEVVEAIKSWLS